MKTMILKSSISTFAIASLLFSAGCSNTSGNLDSAKADSAQTTVAAEASDLANTAEAAEAPQVEEVANVINRPGKVANRGGYIKILVNREPITNYDIQRRSRFLKLRRAPASEQAAEREMIEQAIKLQEAKRIRVLATDKEVNEAFTNFAKGNRATPAIMTRELNKLGVSAQHFKQFIKTQISWQRVVQRKFQNDTVQKSETSILRDLRKSGGTKPELTEYSFKQIVFVVPQNKRTPGYIKARRQEANALRQRFPGCDRSLEAIKGLKDVSVLDRRRIMEPELPDRWKNEVPNATNGVTRVVETENGVEFIAVCNERQVADDRAAQIATQSAEFESFNEKGSQVSQDYLKELRERATVVYR